MLVTNGYIDPVTMVGPSTACWECGVLMAPMDAYIVPSGEVFCYPCFDNRGGNGVDQ